MESKSVDDHEAETMRQRKNSDSAPRLAMAQVRRFIPGARRSGCALIATTLAVACIFGTEPVFRVSPAVRSGILLLWFWNVCIFAGCAAMVLWAWLIDRYSP